MGKREGSQWRAARFPSTSPKSKPRIDTPGHVDFSGEVSTASQLRDGAIVMLDAVEGSLRSRLGQYQISSKLGPTVFVRPVIIKMDAT